MHALLALLLLAPAQDQQVGARTKAMGGSYTAFEDDPVSVWLNPAGISTQPSAVALDYQSYTLYELQISQTLFGSVAETGWSDPALIPSYLGVVFQLGEGDTQHAIGVCFAAPFRTKYAFFDVHTELLALITQEYYRFRAAYAYDFRLREGNEGWFNHISLGFGLDLALTAINADQFPTEFSTDEPLSQDFNDLGFGGGLGVLVGVYDNTTNFKINLGLAYQSRANYNFSISDAILPLFDWPNQTNGGVTFYLLEGQPLRFTFDVQWINWAGATDDSAIDGIDDFEDAVNISMGVEYRIKVSDSVRLYPRAGFRVYDAPWDDERDLPAIGSHLLFIETDDSRFTIFSFGLGIARTMESGRQWKVDIAGDVGGDAVGIAFGFTLEL